MYDPNKLMVPIRFAVLRLVMAGGKRPSCVSRPEWECARTLVKYDGGRIHEFLAAEDLANKTIAEERASSTEH